MAEEKENLAWEEVETEHIVKDKWIDFRRSTYCLPDGNEFGPYYSYSRKDYVVIVATDEEGKFLCVRQYRQGIREVTTEFPAGGIESRDSGKRTSVTDAGDGSGASKAGGEENALAAAIRELREETGYESDEWRHLLTVPSNATMADNYAHIFEAKNCRRAGGQHLDDIEFLNVKRCSSEEIADLVSKGKFQQAIHIMAWLLTQNR